MSEQPGSDHLQALISSLNAENADLRRRLETLTNEQALYRFLIDSHPDLICYLDRDLRYRVCNRPNELGKGDVTGVHIEEALGAGALRQIRHHIDRVLTGEEVAYEDYPAQRPDPKPCLEVLYLPHIDGNGETLGFSSLTRKVDQPPQTGAIPNHDDLTELPNRILFQDRLNQAIYRAIRGKKKIALLLVDLDHFQPINDAHGQGMGDRVLRVIASRLQQSVRRSDTLARIGGDEFVALVEQLDNLRDLQKLAQKLATMLGRPVRIDERMIEISASIGVSLYPEHGVDSSTLLACADRAMRQAKQNGRNQYRVYTPDSAK